MDPGTEIRWCEAGAAPGTADTAEQGLLDQRPYFVMVTGGAFRGYRKRPTHDEYRGFFPPSLDVLSLLRHLCRAWACGDVQARQALGSIVKAELSVEVGYDDGIELVLK